MKIKPIFAPENNERPDGLYSMKYAQADMSEYERIMDQWQDYNTLFTFFKRNTADLLSGFWGDITIGEAILNTMADAETFDETLYDYCRCGRYELQYIFQPLYNSEYRLISLQKSKGKIRRSWLRLYALRLDRNCFIITGGTIKLTHNMQAIHLQEELSKLEQAKRFLQSKHILIPEDLNTIL